VNPAAPRRHGKEKFLFGSLSGLIGDIAWQVSKEGHEVRYYIKDQRRPTLPTASWRNPKNPEKDAEWADIIVFDDTLGQGEKAHARDDPEHVLPNRYRRSLG